MDLGFVKRKYTNKHGFRGMKIDYKITTDGVSCHLNFLKQMIELSKDVMKSEKSD